MRLAAPIDLYFLIIITIVRVTSWLPYRSVRIAVARVLAGLSYHFSLNKRARMKHAVTTAFGSQLGDRELVRILKGSFFDLWWEILGSKPNRIDVDATTEARIIGWNHLEEALAAGKGVILCENGNFGRRFWAKQILNRKGVRVHQIRGANHLSGLEIDSATATWVRRCAIRPFFDDAERPYITEAICLPSTGNLAYGRALLQRLRENAAICVAADGENGARLLALPFLGASYQFSTGMVSLARMSGAAIVPIVCREMDDGKACLIIEEAIWVDEDEDRERQIEQIIARYAALFERYILREPALYRKWHMLSQVQDDIVHNEERLRRDSPERETFSSTTL